MILHALPLVALLFQVRPVHGVRISVVGKDTWHSSSNDENLHGRQTKTASLANIGNTQYATNITIGGKPFTVSIDTGSSDLWVAADVPTATQTTLTAELDYAIGSVQGSIQFAETTFAGLTVPKQAFLSVKPDAVKNMTNDGTKGLIGIGPSSSSVVRKKLADASGNPFLDNVFRLNTTTPNIMTVQLSRDGDTGSKVRGLFTIGEVNDDFEKIVNMPRLPVVVLPSSRSDTQHWTTLIDGFIGPNGKNLSIHSSTPGIPNGKLSAVYDTGFTFPQVPKPLSDAIYQQVPGSIFDSDAGFWILPCDQEVNLTVVIGNQKYPIHPWDTSMKLKLNGTPQRCYGAFQPITSAQDGTFDLILGMAFLRNAYMLVNFGDFVDGNLEHQGDPYMQLLSVTDPAEAHQDFVNGRLEGVDTTASQTRFNTTVIDNIVPPPEDNKGKKFFSKNWPYFVGAALVGFTLIFSGCIWSMMRKRRRGAGPYRPLNDPAPAEAVEVREAYSSPDGRRSSPLQE
ncbi:hypothetical protein M422DRAFT_779838 [Sphaerobolus stellatus SS14]|uniref:Peptidase A1 domain-containing protein n=1 Tax=Sphaerobolus stellatus (strain SS14) TaxID=990650 RepID=A0A0C9VWC6_SPHS4|nr:hypothetical protein M422DRAFT_779838 [Sphaerobolus stellatus SS14]